MSLQVTHPRCPGRPPALRRRERNARTGLWAAASSGLGLGGGREQEDGEKKMGEREGEIESTSGLMREREGGREGDETRPVE